MLVFLGLLSFDSFFTSANSKVNERLVGFGPGHFLLQGVDLLMLQDLTVWLLFTVWPNGLWFVGYVGKVC
jgi:hypothetical protein